MPQASTSAFSGIVSTVVGLIFMGGIAYAVLWAYRQGHLKTALDRLGIATTTPALDTGTAANPFTKPERTPLTPITEGTADPLVGGTTSSAPAVASGGPRLVGTMGSYSGSIFPLNAPMIDMGRDPNNGVPMPQDTNASRRHATLTIENGQTLITDNGSSNGTFVNGVRINPQSPQPLRPGDEVQVGMTRFRYEA